MAGLKGKNTQMFALTHPPAGDIHLAGRVYSLVRIFKHDFWAATCLYRDVEDRCPPDRIVVKYFRTQPFWGMPLDWLGRLMCDREQAIYAALRDLEGVPRWLGRVGEAAFAIEYVDAMPLDHQQDLPDGFFGRLRGLFDAVHSRGVGYADANKRSNILVSRSGGPVLVDFQISIRRRDDWPCPARQLSAALVRYIAHKDIYHLYKHNRRMCPHLMSEEQLKLSRNRGGLHRLHRKLGKPYRFIRRAFLATLHRRGRLVSPTAYLEDHHQPEKATWRGD